MIVVYVVLGFAVGAALAVLAVRSSAQKRLGSSDASREVEAKKLLEAARVEAEALRKDAQIKGKEQALKIRGEIEEEVRQRKAEVVKKEEGLAVRERELDRAAREQQKREDEVARKEKVIAQREQAADSMARQAEQALGEAKVRLEKIAGMSASEARQRLVEQVSDDAKKLAATEVKKIEDQAAEEAQEKAKRILGTAIQRYASEYVGERTVSVVPLPSDDMKGRLIGREGRNVRALEAATGTDLIIDDTPECITISCFNPVRREVARLAIGRLVADGRIHPTRIEEVVGKCEAEVDLSCKEGGEQAVFDLGLHRVHPELVKLLGGLKYRSSYAQNLLAHSIEVGFLAGIMAGELGLNVKQARRAGLFHDIGKAVDHEQEGAHAAVGAQMLKRFGESPKVCQAVAAHHGEVEHESILDHVVDAANLISSQRPGARREQMQAYIKRLDDLEKLAKSYKGVEKAFALQMGKEVRVIVENAAVSDEAALMLSKDIAKRIETEMTYPGQVRVCVVRETRAVDYAK